jgi:type 2 lantibiotic biosynthesis protein LanM
MNREPTLSYCRKIASKATGLRDRIENFHRLRFIPASNVDFKRRLAEWKYAAASDDDILFENRLKNEAISQDMLTYLLGDVSIEPGTDQPAWLSMFASLIDFIEGYDNEHLSSDINRLCGTEKSAKIPYFALIAPVVIHASRMLDEKAGRPKERLLSANALEDVHMQLARMLAFFTGQTFHLEFQVYRSARQSTLWRFVAAQEAGEQPETTLYQEFVDTFLQSGYRRFFEEYAALARIISIIIGNWIRNTTDFLSRLDEDYQAITDHFFAGTPPGRLTEYKGGISDSHDQGKSVVSLRFESGMKLIYKPKNLELEQAWSDFLIWFNLHGLTPSLKPLDVLARGPYGWVGFIESMPCETAAEAADFYRRTGSLVALIYLLNGNDCHHENLIASGAHPVIIDLESIMHHEGRSFVDEGPDSAVFLANSQFGASVFRTGLLPAWIVGKDGYVFDVSGIGGYGHGESPYQQIRWENTNTDQMEFSLAHMKLRELANLPVFEGRKHLPVSYQEEIIEGFTCVYRMFLKFRHEIPIHLFDGMELRFIFRATRIYGLILKKLMNPKFMRSGLERGIQMELLCRAFIHSAPPNPFWNICKSELLQMEGVDFPIFRAGSDSADLRDSTGVIVQDYLEGAVYHQVQQTLQDLGEEDLRKQVKFIRASLFFKDVDHGNKEEEGNPLPLAPETNLVAPVTEPERFIPLRKHHPDDAAGKIFVTLTSSGAVKVDEEVKQHFLATAMTIAGTLRREAIFSKDGSCSWIAVGIIPGADKYRMQPTSMYLYDGLSGIALFLSALYRLTGDRDIGQLNEATLKSLFRGIDIYHKFTGLSRIGSVGVASGLSSVVYALTGISSLLEERLYLDKALEFSRSISPEMIRNDNTFDVLTGSAGCALAMFNLYKTTGDSQSLEKMTLCGDHLLEKAVYHPDGSCGWNTIRGKMLTGLSHGSAGIAFALFKVFEITGKSKYFDAAVNAIRYENSQFSAEHQNWHDLRELPGQPDGQPQFMVSWCHGAPGIALGRLAARHIYKSETQKTDISAALGTTMKTGMMNADHLCCGNLGRAEVLFYAGMANKDSGLMNMAYARALQSIERADTKGNFNLFHQNGGHFFNPGFFQGLSGIGYELLRLGYGGNIPSILVFE